MFNFLFNQPYINISIIVLAALLFLIMFLWRKLTILEGNFFLLEKRVNIIKKGERTELLAKNWNNYDKTMNEIFKDSIVTDDNDVSDKCCEPVNNVSGKCYNGDIDSDKCYNGDNDTYDKSYKGDICNSDHPLKKEEVVINKKTTVKLPKEVQDFVDIDDDSVTHITLSDNNKSFYDIGDYNTEETVSSNVNDNMDIADNISVSSDITFNNEGDKSSIKKYKNMNLEKLREECVEKQLNTEGTKTQLVTRIVEHFKKQK